MIYKPFEKWGSVLINHLLLVIPVIPMSLYKFVSSFVTKTHTRARTHAHTHTTHTHTQAQAHTHIHTWISRSQTLQSELSQRVQG